MLVRGNREKVLFRLLVLFPLKHSNIQFARPLRPLGRQRERPLYRLLCANRKNG